MHEIKNDADIHSAKIQYNFSSYFSFPIDSYTKLVSFAPKEFIVQEGVVPSNLFFLTCGRAKLYTTMANGKVALIDFFQAPCFIGELELVGHTQDVCSVQAVEHCLCLSVPVAQCGEALLKDPVFLRNICLYLGNKLSRNIRLFARNQTFPLENRLAGFILLSAVFDIYEEKHSHAAEYLGVSYRHLLFVLANFVQQGILAKENRQTKIINRQALLQLAQSAYPDFF